MGKMVEEPLKLERANPPKEELVSSSFVRNLR
jgi:hypothetical protein